ncbi:MAG: hypothetical protein HOV94_19815 [Saccharothrix sp.]|nr:hypothetical protein [Saccharothrix sp.]
MKRRATAVIAACAAAALVTGLLVWWRSGPDAPPASDTTPGTGPGREAGVAVGVRVGDRQADRGWLLMASEEVAGRTPPEDIVDCRRLHAWALREGALPVGVVAHTITLSADRPTAVESTYVRVRPDPTPYPTGRQAPVVRLRCLPHEGAAPPLPDPHEVRFRVNGDAVPVTFEERHEVAPGADAAFDVLVDLTGTTGPFAYRFEVGVVEGGSFRMVEVDGGGGPFFATEDAGAMGYWPATTTWTMHPARTRVQCPAMSDPSPQTEGACP